MYQVDWLQTAVAQLTGAWIQADSALRAAITAAVRQVGVSLRDDPSSRGESRSEDRRVLLVSPIGVIFRVDPQEHTVLVLRAWVFRQRRRSGEETE
jgi:hypothetical protein